MAETVLSENSSDDNEENLMLKFDFDATAERNSLGTNNYMFLNDIFDGYELNKTN